MPLHLTLGDVLQVMFGGGLVAGAWRAGGAVRDFRRAVEAIATVLEDHLKHHPAPTEREEVHVHVQASSGP